MNFSEHRPKVYFKTFGCRTNIFDTQVMISNLKDFDVTNNEKEANVVIINSCTVTNSADTTARSYINSLKKLENSPKVIFTGCGTRTKGEKLFVDDKIDGLFGSSEKENINELLKLDDKSIDMTDYMIFKVMKDNTSIIDEVSILKGESSIFSEYKNVSQ